MCNKIFIYLLVVLFSVRNINAQDKICHTWYTHEKNSAVQIYMAADGKYYGKITWLKDAYENGKPLLDVKNPDKTKRRNPYLGLVIITGLTKKTETEYVGGKLYEPSKGNYYSCKMTVQNNNELALRGYIFGMPFLGRTTIWYLKSEKPIPFEAPLITGKRVVDSVP